MASQNCADAISKALGRPLDEGEIERIEKAVDRQMKKRLRDNPGESESERAYNAAQDVANSNIAEAIKAKRNAALNFEKGLMAANYIKTVFPDRPDLGLEAMLVGANIKRAGARMSTNLEQIQLFSYYAHGAMADLEKAGVTKIFASGALDLEVRRALRDIADPERFKTHGEIPRKIAEVVEKWQEVARVDANKAGAFIDKLEGRGVAQSHSQGKILAAKQETWVNDVINRLDERTFDHLEEDTPAARIAMLKAVFDGLASGKHIKAGDNPLVGNGFKSTAKSMSHERVLFFKTADDEHWYNQTYGSNNLREQLFRSLESSANKTGLMRVWGPNAEMTYRKVYDDLIKASPDAESRKRLAEASEKLDNRWKAVDGSMNIPGKFILARVGAITRAIESMAHLGGAVLSSIPDIATRAFEIHRQGPTWLASYGEALKQTFSGVGKLDRDIAGEVGIVARSVLADVGNRYSAHDDLPGKISRLQQLFFRLNLLDWWTERNRVHAAVGASWRLASNADTAFDKLSGQLRPLLERYGIFKEEWNLYRKSAVKLAEDGEKYMTPEAFKPEKADLEKYLTDKGIKPTDRKIAELGRELQDKLRSYFIDRTDYAVLQPDAKIKAITSQGTQPGTYKGEGMRFITQFKSYPITFIDRVLGAELHGYSSEARSTGSALRDTLTGKSQGELSGLVNVILATTALGYVAMTAKEYAQGKEPRDFSWKTMLKAMQQGGGLGIYGDFLFGDMVKQYGRNMISTLAGPTAGTLNDLVSVMGSIVQKGEVKGGEIVGAVKSNTPFANLFYTKMALDYGLIYGLQERLNPGYLRRMEKRIKKENEQDYWLSPSRNAVRY